MLEGGGGEGYCWYVGVMKGPMAAERGGGWGRSSNQRTY